MDQSSKSEKSTHALREEKILAYWKDKNIFEKTMTLPASGGKSKGEFIFYEGPPTANGHPGIHHLVARAFKDAVPRFKTMRGYHVRRKSGWDTHGLPVELQVEKELGLKSKKEIEKYGIAAFNEKCKESVWTYVHEWEQFTDRIGYWVDLKDPYITYKSNYIESLWSIVETVEEKGLLYKDYKVVPWCPRCGTGLSSHELAQGYADVKDLSVTVKFKIEKSDKFDSDKDTFILAWTTTPWTLPGNVALAVNEKIEYIRVRTEDCDLILAKERIVVLKDIKYEIIDTVKGTDLIGLKYEHLYSFIKDNIDGTEKGKLDNAYKVYSADFVNTSDGTGIVHTAVMYGQDDFELGSKIGLPKYHLVNEDGTFKTQAGFLSGKFVKDEATDVEIIKDLAKRGLLFAKEKYQHSYPFCWRCHTPLIYFARDSWYIKMSDLRKKLVKENEDINWEPKHIRDGRFGEWLREVKDWAISRERYWGTPLPIWVCDVCKERKVAGSVEDIAKKSKNSYFVMRHGEAENNAAHLLDSESNSTSHLTTKGQDDVKNAANSLKKSKIDIIYYSPLARTKETATIVKETLGLADDKFIADERLREMDQGQWSGRSAVEFDEKFPLHERFDELPDGVEDYTQIRRRVGDLLYEIENKHKNQNILFVTHGSPAMMLMSVGQGYSKEQTIRNEIENYISKSESRILDVKILPHNQDYELDLHRPYIDEVKLNCKCGASMTRVKEVMDVWFDSGAMPFAQDHYPFENKKYVDKIGYPADFISEAIDQTRGWFYTLHAIGALLGKGKAYKNVICLGHILDAEGKKMSKSIGNVVNPWEMIDKFGADALRMWMYSVNQPGDSKNFDPKTVDEINKKVFNLALNVLAFYELYAGGADSEDGVARIPNSQNVLDRWIVARLAQLLEIVTNKLENYEFFEPTRAIRDFIGDLSQWYIRRSRDRFKSDNENDKRSALETTRFILITLAKIMAPFTPFFAEHIYQGLKGEKESVHLESWPDSKDFKTKSDHDLINNMDTIRSLSSKGLEARMMAKINVRQPLASLKIREIEAVPDELAVLIKDEVNVKNIVWNAKTEKDVELDIILTPELKEEGEVRELLRRIQDLRKEKGFKVNDIAILVATADLRDLISKDENTIKIQTKLSKIEYGQEFGLKEGN
ncbi:MAG: class I tRNA ligase family protein [Candidatus Paceibacterota bacterium]|jgi:isoleucyl-tRNA synthetase